jgi:hypothetical protein
MVSVSLETMDCVFYAAHEGTEHCCAVTSGQLLWRFLRQHLEACMLLNICATETHPMQNRQCLRSTRNLYHMDFFIDNRLMYNVVLHVAFLPDAFSRSTHPMYNILGRVSV